MENIDPCKPTEHVRLPRLETRYLNSLTTILNAVYNDSVLPLTWYNVGKNPMPNRPPHMNGCGTHFPIYSTGKIIAYIQIDCFRGMFILLTDQQINLITFIYCLCMIFLWILLK